MAAPPPAPSVRVERIGREGEPVVVIDGFAADAAALRTAAAALTFAPDGTHYPGVKAAVPSAYFADVAPTVGIVLRDVFGFAEPAGVIAAWYQLVTTPPAALTLMQRLPHVDALRPRQIALVHFLGHENRGGTAFYRHRATGFETLDEARAPAFRTRLAAEVAATPPPNAYIDDGAPWFERIAAVAPAFNRALVYRSALLHCGLIPTGAVLSADPLVGRLTVGAFLGPGGRTAR